MARKKYYRFFKIKKLRILNWWGQSNARKGCAQYAGNSWLVEYYFLSVHYLHTHILYFISKSILVTCHTQGALSTLISISTLILVLILTSLSVLILISILIFIMVNISIDHNFNTDINIDIGISILKWTSIGTLISISAVILIASLMSLAIFPVVTEIISSKFETKKCCILRLVFLSKILTIIHLPVYWQVLILF